MLGDCALKGPFKLMCIKIATGSGTFQMLRGFCVNILGLLFVLHTKRLLRLKNTKKVVPKSDFQYISMISADFDGIEVDFKRFS